MTDNKSIETRIKNTKLTPQEELDATNIWELLTTGKTKRQILKQLEMHPKQYDRLLEKTLKTYRPTESDINRERTIAHDRYSKIFAELNNLAERAKKPSDKIYILKELRATTKSVVDLYGAEMPKEIQVEVTDNRESNNLAKNLIEALTRQKSDQPTLEAEVIDEGE
jgi:hypothetical protein